MTETVIFTVPHTGTHFIAEFLTVLGMKSHVNNTSLVPANKFCRIHSYRTTIKDVPGGYYSKLLNSKVIVAARIPYMTVFRRIAQENSIHTVDTHAERWNCFLDVLPELDHVVLDITCREEEKYIQLVNIAKHVNQYSPDKEQLIQAYADAWKPQNVSDTVYKKEFLETGALPEGHNWSRFDRAVEWYKSLPTNDF